MSKRFIVFIDFSEHSINLIKYAYQWSIAAKAQLLLLHQSIVQSPALADFETKQEYIAKANEAALQKLKSLASDVLPHPENVQYHVSELDFQISLPQLLEEPFEDIVFVGIKGTSRMKKLFFGSYALNVINQIDNIVVGIPQTIDQYSHEKIFAAVNEKQPINTEALNNLFQFIDKEDTQITFFHLTKEEENTTEIEDTLKSLASHYAGDFKTHYAIYTGKNRIEDIKKVINNQIDEILVVQRSSPLLTDKLFRRFLIDDLVHEGETPLIVLP